MQGSPNDRSTRWKFSHVLTVYSPRRPHSSKRRRGVNFDWLENRQLMATTAQVATTTINASVTYTKTTDWGSGFTASMTIRNTGSTAINGWKLEFDLPVSITNIWNAKVVGQAGSHFVLQDMGYNLSLIHI